MYGKTIITAIVMVALILVAVLFATDGKNSILSMWENFKTAAGQSSYQITTAPDEIIVGEDALFVSDIPFDKFKEVKVDGEVINSTNYTATADPTKVTLKGNYTNTLSTGKHTITIVSNDGYAKTSFDIIACKIVSWTDGTDEEIAAMVAAADAGKINLADYWSVGDERQVTLSAMSATGVGESHASQTVTLVLLNQGGYELTNGKICNFIVGQKNALAETGYMNSTNTNSGSWDGSARRAWCNSTYYNAYPETLKPIFKQFKTVTAETYNGTALKTSNDYFALAAQKEIFGGANVSSAGGASGYSNATEFNTLTQFEYYKTASNRIKKLGDSGSATGWWGRSPSGTNASVFCGANDSTGVGNGGAVTARAIAPFGCI